MSRTAPQLRAASPLHIPRRCASTQPEGFFRGILRKLNPINAYRDTKALVRSVQEFGSPEMTAAVRALAVVEKKVEKAMKETAKRDKEINERQAAFHARLEVELQKLQQASANLDPQEQMEFVRAQTEVLQRLFQASSQISKEYAEDLGKEWRKLLDADPKLAEEVQVLTEQARAGMKLPDVDITVEHLSPQATKQIPLYTDGMKSYETISVSSPNDVSQPQVRVIKPEFVLTRAPKQKKEEQRS